MTTVADVVSWLDRFAPSALAESWDNVGLLWGDPRAVVTRVMTCLTVTPETADEAVERGAGLIVSHHPILFRPVQRVVSRPGDPHGFLWPLARSGVAVASPHTAFDNCEGGINDTLAERLGLIDVVPLRPGAAAAGACKVVVFAPEGDRAAVLGAAFDAGAGRIGDYRECSFGATGTGTFFGEEGANPAVGQAGRREEVVEWRLEVLCPKGRLGAVLAAIRAAHSYEEPAIDVYPLMAGASRTGQGRLGRLPVASRLGDFAAHVAERLGSPDLHYAGDPGRPVGRVAIACGAGDDFLRDAAACADVLLTGEARYHRAIEADALGVGLILAGHHATERIGVEALAGRIARDFADLDVWASQQERDPLRTLVPAQE
jgi:dinuclear metal center YbgI/SA1388 family protein